MKSKLTTKTTCNDTDDTFFVDDDALERNCYWLRTQNHASGEVGDTSLCDFSYVAAKCPKTCQVCDIYDQVSGLLDLEKF